MKREQVRGVAAAEFRCPKCGESFTQAQLDAEPHLCPVKYSEADQFRAAIRGNFRFSTRRDEEKK